MKQLVCGGPTLWDNDVNLKCIHSSVGISRGVGVMDMNLQAASDGQKEKEEDEDDDVKAELKPQSDHQLRLCVSPDVMTPPPPPLSADYALIG